MSSGRHGNYVIAKIESHYDYLQIHGCAQTFLTLYWWVLWTCTNFFDHMIEMEWIFCQTIPANYTAELYRQTILRRLYCADYTGKLKEKTFCTYAFILGETLLFSFYSLFAPHRSARAISWYNHRRTIRCLVVISASPFVNFTLITTSFHMHLFRDNNVFANSHMYTFPAYTSVALKWTQHARVFSQFFSLLSQKIEPRIKCFPFS